MKKVVVLMTSQIAGEVFEKIRFDRSVKADYFLFSQDHENSGLENKLQRADGVLVVIDGIFAEAECKAFLRDHSLPDHLVKIAVLLCNSCSSPAGYIVIKPSEEQPVDTNLIRYILYNGHNPRKPDWVGLEKLLMKYVVPFLILLLLYILNPWSIIDENNTVSWLAENRGLSVFVGTLILWIVVVNIYNAVRISKEEFRKEIDRIEGFFSKTNPSSSNQNDQLSGDLMTYNLRSIYRNIRWGQQQAKIAFVFGIVFSVCGLLVYCLPLIMHKELGNASVVSSVISPLIGGTISELIGATAMLIYSKSIRQLNYYHKALHENERFLSCINIIHQLHCNEQDRISMVDKVVSCYIESGQEEQLSASKDGNND